MRETKGGLLPLGFVFWLYSSSEAIKRSISAMSPEGWEDYSRQNMHQLGQTPLGRLETADFVSIFSRAGQPSAVHTGPLSEVHNPRIVLRLFALSVGSIENLRAEPVLAL